MSDESKRLQIGKNVRRLRDARRWTQVHLAQDAKIGIATVSRIERGHEGVSDDKHADVARALGVTVEDLERADGTLPAAPPPSDPVEGSEVLRVFRSSLFQQSGMLTNFPLMDDVELGSYGPIVDAELVMLDNIATLGFELPAQRVHERRKPLLCQAGTKLERSSSGGLSIDFSYAGAFYLKLSGVRVHGYTTLLDLAARLATLPESQWRANYRLVTNCWSADHILLLIAGQPGSKIELGPPSADGSMEIESSHDSIIKAELGDAKPMFMTRQLSADGRPYFRITPHGPVRVNVSLEPTPIEDYLGFEVS